MGRAPCCEKVGIKRGRWTAEEDDTLRKYIQANGEGSWRSLPKNAGLLRCGKSCRLRWINYLRSDLKRGNITAAEEDIIINLHATMGNRWSLIAGYLPGRTDNEIKNYWNSHLSRKIQSFRRLNPNFIPPPLPPDSSATVKSNKQTGGKTKKKKNKNSNNRKNTATPKPPIILLSEQDQQITEEEEEVRINGGVEIMPTTPSPEKEALLSTSSSSSSSHAHVECQEKRIINVVINNSSPPEEGMGAAADQTEEIENRRRSLMLSINSNNNGMGSSGILCLDDMMADFNDIWSMEEEDRELESTGTILNDCLGITNDEELGNGINNNNNNNNNNIPGLLDNGGVFDLDQLMRSPGPAGNNSWEWNWGQEENTTSLLSSSSSSSWLWDSEKLGGGGDLERSFEMAEEDEKQNAILLSWLLS